MCYVRLIRYRMHVSDAIFKEPRVRIVIYIQKWISIRLVDALFDRCPAGRSSVFF